MYCFFPYPLKFEKFKRKRNRGKNIEERNQIFKDSHLIHSLSTLFGPTVVKHRMIREF